MAAPSVVVIDHPVVQHKLTLMRRRETSTASFRALLREVSMLLAYEVTRDLPLHHERITTPLTEMDAPVLEGKKLVFVVVLRAGLGMVDGLLEVLPSARVGHVGLYRDPHTLQPVQYYCKVPDALGERDVVVVDPMLATGNSAVAAVSLVAELAPRSLKLLSLIAAPEGIATFHARHPEVPVYTAAVDSHLDDHAYIVPGLGDAGDRLFGTR